MPKSTRYAPQLSRENGLIGFSADNTVSIKAATDQMKMLKNDFPIANVESESDDSMEEAHSAATGRSTSSVSYAGHGTYITILD